MIRLPGYTTIDILHERSRSILHRGLRIKDRLPVVIKTLRSEYPAAQELARLRHEAAILQSIHSTGVATVYALEKLNNSWALTQSELRGQTLAQLLSTGRLAPSQALQIAISVADILHAVHRQRIVHRDLHPRHILFDVQTGDVSLTGFSAALRLFDENSDDTFAPDSTSAYTAPEQTGRMNRKVDERADLYSCGVTLYELLTGRTPFLSSDPVELTHSHLARTPASPEQLVPSIPPLLSALVMKLLAKVPEERYQTAFGLKADLQECARRLQATGQIAPFQLASQDKPDELHLPQRLYGRADEVQSLLTAWQHICQGPAALVLVSGYSGIGKTALVTQLIQPVSSRGGRFVSGKFDQLSRSAPYSAVGQALRTLVTQLLSEPTQLLAEWRRNIQNAVGNNGSLLTDLCPELALVIGPQPPVSTLGPTESQNRFSLVLQNFTRLFATAERPLVLFLDDLHWADSASLRLLQTLLHDPEHGHLLIAGAYRDQDVGSAHPLSTFREALRQTSIPVTEIKLGPLSEPDVVELTAAMLGFEQDPAQVTTLGRLAFNKTQGNPFFLAQFLAYLHGEKLLHFDVAAWKWSWIESKISSLKVTDNVVDLMASKLQRFATATVEIVKLAACIGFEFDLPTLSLIAEKTPPDVVIDLWPAIQEGLILSPVPSEKELYRFSHDRVQQAAYSLHDGETRKRLHLRIGRLLLSQLAPSSELPFNVIDHVNLGASLISDAEERLRLADMNLTAARRAKASTAYAAAVQYLKRGIALVPGGFHESYELYFALNLECADCENLSGNFEDAQQRFALLLEHARTDIERGQIYFLHLLALSSRGQYADAIRIGLSGLALFGITFPPTSELMMASLPSELAAINTNLGERSIEQLLDVTIELDATQQIAMRLMSATSTAAFFGDSALLAVVMVKAVNYTLQHGHSAWSAYSYITYGFMLATRLSRYEEGLKFGRLAMELNKKFKNPELSSRLPTIFASYYHFYEHLSDVRYFKEGYDCGLEIGDFVHLSASCTFTTFYDISLGRSLSHTRAEADKKQQLMKLTRDSYGASVLTYLQQMMANLQGKTHGRATLSDDAWNETETVALDRQRGVFPTLMYYVVIKLQLAFLYEDIAAAAAIVIEADTLSSDIMPGLYVACQASFWICLTLLAPPQSATGKEREAHNALLGRHRRKLREWATGCPANYQHLHLLVSAETARQSGNFAEAASLYDQAIATAQQNDFTSHTALGNELAARFYHARGRDKLARIYLQEALLGYRMWGATAKVMQLQEQHGALLESAAPATQQTTATVDMLAVIRASQALSGEIALEPLLERLMIIAIENAGAERGLLLRNRGGDLQVAAAGVLMKGALQVTLHTDGGAAHQRPASILNYVARTSRFVVLDHATSDATFAADPFVQRAQLKSVLCMPLLRQGTLVAVLYLENNLTTRAFTPERIAVLDVLASQAAISLENATLYHELHAENRERRRAEAEVRQLNAELEQRVLDRTAELRAANQELEAFSYSVSHDLRAPLRAIDGFSRALQEDYEHTLEPDAKEYLRRLRAGCTSMSELVEDILRLSRVTTGELDRSDVDLSTIATQIADELKTSDRQRQVTFVIAPDLRGNGDKRLLRVALENLLSNAWKYTSQHETAHIEVGSFLSNSRRVFFVRDDGAGFDMRYAARLFAPFQRMHSAAQFPGTGVGLATVQRIIYRHGGHLWAEAAPEKGATFFFVLQGESAAQT